MARAALLALLPSAALLLLPACGGRTAGESNDAGTSTDAGGTSSSDGGSSTDGSSLGFDATPFTDSGTGATCVDIDPAAFSTACAVDDDCINVYTGKLCDGYDCTCGGTAISASAQEQYTAITSTVTPGTGPFCSCPYLGAPRCIQKTCVYCPNPALGGPLPAGCPDAG